MDNLESKIKELESLIQDKYDTGIYGTMVDRLITCGKPGCKCKSGYKHGPYAHIQLYDKNNTLRGIYIGNKKKDYYQEQIERNKEFFTIIKQLNKLYLLRRERNRGDH